MRIAVIGPGRLGQAMARRWVEAGAELLGFLGRRPGTASLACEFAAAGQAFEELHQE